MSLCTLRAYVLSVLMGIVKGAQAPADTPLIQFRNLDQG